MTVLIRPLEAITYLLMLTQSLIGFVDLKYDAKIQASTCQSGTITLSVVYDNSFNPLSFEASGSVYTKDYDLAGNNEPFSLSFVGSDKNIKLNLDKAGPGNLKIANTLYPIPKYNFLLKDLLFGDIDFTLTHGSKLLCKMRFEAPDSLNAIVQRRIISDKLNGIFTISGATPACPPTVVSGWSGNSRAAINRVEISFDAGGSCNYSQDPSEPLLLRRIGNAPERVPRSHSHPAKVTIKSLKMIQLKKSAKPFEVRPDEIR